MPGWSPAPPPAPKRSRTAWIVAAGALLAIAGTMYALQVERTDEEKAKNQTRLEEATERVNQSLDEALARDPDVDNAEGSAPKAMEISGGPSRTRLAVQVPPGWVGRVVGQRVLSSAIEAFLNGEPTSGFAPNIVIEVTTVDVDGAPLEQLSDQAIESSGETLQGMRAVGSPKRVQVGGEEGLARDYTADVQGGQLSAQLVVTVHDDRAYFFYLSTLRTQRQEAQPLFDEFLDTLEFE